MTTLLWRLAYMYVSMLDLRHVQKWNLLSRAHKLRLGALNAAY
jgi:hypothetical protein